MELSYSNLKKYALLYVTLPMFIFFIGYLKWYFAIVCCSILFYSLYKAIDDSNVKEEKRYIFFISNKTINLVFFIALLWTYLGGMNGFYFQSSDWDCRNAIYHDLVNFDWPVIYESTGSALVYYIGFWLPPAILAKFINFIGGGNETLTWFAARQFLWIWAALGVFLVLMLLMALLKSDNNKKRILTIVMLIFFGGMDVIGSWLFGNLSMYLNPVYLHIEWWSNIYQFSSFTTCLFWVFNQSIITWICVLCFLFEKTPKNYLLIGMSCMFSGPIPFVGLFVFMVAQGIYWLIKKLKVKEIKSYLKEIFSLPNCLLILTVFPVFALYFLSNTAINTGSSDSLAWPTIGQYITSPVTWIFFLLEAGIYLLLMLGKYKRTFLYYVTMVSLMVIPFFHIGEASDFCMRASLPAIFILMIFCCKYLISIFNDFNKERIVHKVTCFALMGCLIIGSFTSMVEFFRGFYYVDKYKTVCLEKNMTVSFDGTSNKDNFVTDNYSNKLFYKYLSK